MALSPFLHERMSHPAACSSRPSSPRRPTSWTPTGSPFGPVRSGSDTAGMPHSDHSVLKAGLPVEARPSGASPGAAGVRIASYSSEDFVQLGVERLAKVERREIIDRRDRASGLDRLPHRVTQFVHATVVVGAVVPGDTGEGERRVGGNRLDEPGRKGLRPAGLAESTDQALEGRLGRRVRPSPMTASARRRKTGRSQVKQAPRRGGVAAAGRKSWGRFRRSRRAHRRAAPRRPPIARRRRRCRAGWPAAGFRSSG